MLPRVSVYVDGTRLACFVVRTAHALQLILHSLVAREEKHTCRFDMFEV